MARMDRDRFPALYHSLESYFYIYIFEVIRCKDVAVDKFTAGIPQGETAEGKGRCLHRRRKRGFRRLRIFRRHSRIWGRR